MLFLSKERNTVNSTFSSFSLAMKYKVLQVALASVINLVCSIHGPLGVTVFPHLCVSHYAPSEKRSLGGFFLEGAHICSPELLVIRTALIFF